MSQQYPGPQQQPQHQQPHQGHTVPGGYPGAPAPYQPPPPPKKGLSNWAIAGITVGGVFAFLIILGIAFGDGEPAETATSAKPDTAAAAPKNPVDDKPAAEEEPKEEAPQEEPKKEATQAEQFRAFVEENGTPAEQDAVTHVVKVQGADSNNNILDTAEIWTDYTGGLLGPNASKGKILASAFADWKQSKNGLVTVYDEQGEILSNGNY
ncbi:hypothetical protein [Streptomyces sp. C10-9-1]|uniref:hypothetical protein n=1 Tax=Streptomyces sp. C10-9-1 TaxID=1859285 RepID=UPI003F4A0830